MTDYQYTDEEINIYNQAKHALVNGDYQGFRDARARTDSPNLVPHFKSLIAQRVMTINPMQYGGLPSFRTTRDTSEIDAFYILAAFAQANPEFLDSFVDGTRAYLEKIAADPNSGAFFRIFDEAKPGKNEEGDVVGRGKKITLLSKFVTPAMVSSYFANFVSYDMNNEGALFIDPLVNIIVNTRPELIDALPKDIFYHLGRLYTKRLEYSKLEKLAEPAIHGLYHHNTPIIDELEDGVRAGMEKSSDYKRKEMRSEFKRNKVFWGGFRGDPIKPRSLFSRLTFGLVS